MEKQSGKIRSWSMHRQGAAFGISLTGESLADAVVGDLNRGPGKSAIAREASLGNAAGYQLKSVRIQYAAGILGGKGGAEIIINHRGMDLAHRPAGAGIARATVWMHASREDIPQPIEIEAT